ncbi:DEAD/DEAH box helicase family protein [Phyllobacterium sp. 22229]|uniref:DEAD/DEAH box helicase family protein n=1 Tax=Phyllobacterium sp. 22229 TaxID=3453895 RepID=UPI003F82A05A
MSETRHSLAEFQLKAVDGIKAVVQRVATMHDRMPNNRGQIALKSGVTLLQSPTGSGKTLMLGRVLEGVRGSLSRPTVWFWFAPYSGLVAQTRDALTEQCSSLRVRDLTRDRESIGSRDGDVFIQTWATVAASNKDARKVRRTSESSLSFDDMLANLRSGGFFIGAVIDEAHLNFGASAAVAADYFLEHIQPDFTILATATPNDDKLEAFEKKAGIEVASRYTVARNDVVDAGLNKVGLKLGVIRFSQGDERLIDHEQATLQAAWTQHMRVKARLIEREIAVSPLMLVQVEDQDKGGDDPVKRVRDKLIEIGVAEEAIATHTSGEPDPDFHTLAYDPDKHILIFKVAVATGFDAPRAWTLVSVRPNRGKEFGLQIVGRIMRVHPMVRPIHGSDPVLDNGYVLLTDPSMQLGLEAAVEELKAVRSSIEMLTDKLDIYEVDGVPSTSVMQGDDRLKAVRAPLTSEERNDRLTLLIDHGIVRSSVREMSDSEQQDAIVRGEVWQAIVQTPLFGDLPEIARPAGQMVPAPKTATGRYPLRKELGLPSALSRELPPDPARLNDLVQDIAKDFCRSTDIIGMLQRKLTKAQMDLKSLFAAENLETIDLRLRLSNARIAEQAQLAFKFNDSIDPRYLKPALVDELRRIVDDRGMEVPNERDLRRAVDLAVMMEPEALKGAIKTAQARHVRIGPSDPIPEDYFGPEGLARATKGAYGVFPDRLNKEEGDFARFLDADETGTVKWWLRNPENTRWATQLLLPSGHRFFPDFVVGVRGRTTPDGIALIEIKDDGETGRLNSDNNVEKARVQHRDYRNVFWTFRSDGTWVRGRYSDSLHKIVEQDRFEIKELVFLA